MKEQASESEPPSPSLTVAFSVTVPAWASVKDGVQLTVVAAPVAGERVAPVADPDRVQLRTSAVPGSAALNANPEADPSVTGDAGHAPVSVGATLATIVVRVCVVEPPSPSATVTWTA